MRGRREETEEEQNVDGEHEEAINVGRMRKRRWKR